MHKDDKPYFGEEDTQTELYAPENRDFVGFDKFAGFEKSVKKFRETLKNFDDSEQSFFDAIIYSAMFYKSEGKIIDRNKVKEELNFTIICLKLKIILNLIEQSLDILTDVFKLMLMKSLLDIIFSLNLLNVEICLGFLYRKKVHRKNRGTRNLSSSVFRVFDGYDMIRPQLAHKERIEVTPIKIVYEPSCDEKTPVSYFFTDQIHKAY